MFCFVFARIAGESYVILNLTHNTLMILLDVVCILRNNFGKEIICSNIGESYAIILYFTVVLNLQISIGGDPGGVRGSGPPQDLTKGGPIMVGPPKILRAKHAKLYFKMYYQCYSNEMLRI